MLGLPRRENDLRRSASNLSLHVKRHGCFGRLRRSPNFILFTVFLALFVDMATYGIIVPIIPFIVSDKMDGGATDTGLLLAVYAVGILLSSPLFGVLGDHFVSRRVPMLIGLVGMLLSTVLFMVATNFYVFLLARLLQGVAGGSVWTLGLALITDVFPANVLGVQMGKALVGYTLGLMMGPPLGGILYERGGYQAPFIFCCVITLIDFACRALIIEEREEIVKALRTQGKQEEATEEEAEVVAARKKERLEEGTSFWKLIKNKRLMACIIVTACNSFVFSGAEPTVPLHLASAFDLTSERIGLVFMAFSLPTLTAPISGALSDRFGARGLCVVAIILCGTAVILTGVYQNSLPMIIFLFTIIGTTGTAILTPVLGEISAVVRTTGAGDGFARAYAMFNMAFSIGVLVGPVVCGIVYERLGFRAICLTMSGSLFLSLPVAALWFGGVDQKSKDLQKYKEDEDRRRGTGGLTRSKYSLEFQAGAVEEGMSGRFSPGEDSLVEKQVDGGGKDGSKGLVGMRGSREDILKSARLD
ncbi:MAG: major facilitator superfamily domain-containing protein [Linnemannia gamsii]|nr:MAG: major facilitator superfamily domain-containing protein [Linnemannia gamsii]